MRHVTALVAVAAMIIAVPVLAIAQTAPVSGTMISLGSVAGEVLLYVVAGIAPIIAIFIVNWLLKAAALVGVKITDDRRARLQEMIENGVKWAAQKLGVILDGKLTVDVKNKIIADIVNEYLPKHAAETVKKLGGDVKNTKAMTEVVAARAADMFEIPAEVRAIAKMASGVVGGPTGAVLGMASRMGGSSR